MSKPNLIFSKVSQGVIIDTLLFFIYVSDLFLIKRCNLLMYADNITLIFEA